MSMSYEFVSGGVRKYRIFEMKSHREKILKNLKLPETKEELEVYNQHKEQIIQYYETLKSFDNIEHAKALLKVLK